MSHHDFILQAARRLVGELRRPDDSVTQTQWPDVHCLKSECVFAFDADGKPLDAVQYLIFQTEQHANGRMVWHGYRVVKVSELKYLPQESRADPSLIGKQAALLRGLYAANVEPISLHFGIFDPPLGIVQCYGAASRHPDRQTAIDLAASAHAATIASLTAQYPQSRFAPLTVERGRWLWEALAQMKQATALIGQPDPREGARGGGQESRAGTGEYSAQQNEILFRALSRAREEFLFLNIATPVDRHDIATMLESLAELTSPFASRQAGSSAIGCGLSLPVLLNAGQAYSASESFGTSQTEGESSGESVTHGSAHTAGVAESSGWSVSHGVAQTDGQAQSNSVSHASGVTHSSGVSQGTSESFAEMQTQSQAHTVGSAHTAGSFSSSSVGGSHVETHGGTHTETDPAGMGNVNISLAPADLGLKFGYSDNITGPTVSDTSSWSVSDGSSWASSSGVSSSVTQSETTTVGSSLGQSHSLGASQATHQSVSVSEVTSVGQATTHSQSLTSSETVSTSGSRTVSESDTVSQAVSASSGRSATSGLSLGRALGASHLMGLGAGVAPSASLSKSFQWKDEAAAALTELLEQQLNVLKEASEEGGFYSDVYLLTRTPRGCQVAEAGAVQAFGGSQGVVTHVQARRPHTDRERQHLLDHARTFTPSPAMETLGYLNGYRYSTLLTPTQQAAYSAPGLFEEGTALTVQERTPPFAFLPAMKGEAVLGHLYSTERGELTEARLVLEEGRHFHTLFASDTGFGKTVAAERLAVEAVNQWHHRVVALDFGAGWQRLTRGPVSDDRVQWYQLFPGAPHPFRWNFMQIGRRLDPDRQVSATAELIANAGRMGPRQLGYIKRAMWELYTAAGIFLTDPSVHTDARWGQVSDAEARVLLDRAAAAGRPAKGVAGRHVLDLGPFERQALAVHRSGQVNMAALHARLKWHYDNLPKGDQVGRTSLEGVLLRLEPFTHGELSMMYSGSSDNIAIEDLGMPGKEPELQNRWGLCVLEGGAEMDEYAKALVLSLAAWHLYNDSIVRRREMGETFIRPLDIFFEEANKILSGAVNTVGSDGASGTANRAAAVELWQQMWRDGRKYKIYLHPIAQTISELPAGIQASCNNSFFGQMKNLADRDLAVGHLARSERGFTDEEYKRYLSRIPRGLAIVKLGYSDEVMDMEPMLVRPLRVRG